MIQELLTDRRVMVFRIEHQFYALPLLKVKEVIAAPDLTSVAFMPNFFKGVLNLRGHVISVIDLKIKLKNEEIHKNHETCIIIVDSTESSIGLMVDSVEFVTELAEDTVTQPEAFEGAPNADFLAGMAKFEDKIIQILKSEFFLETENEIRNANTKTTMEVNS